MEMDWESPYRFELAADLNCGQIKLGLVAMQKTFPHILKTAVNEMHLTVQGLL
jgi:hypothetical protein